MIFFFINILKERIFYPCSCSDADKSDRGGYDADKGYYADNEGYDDETLLTSEKQSIADAAERLVAIMAMFRFR